MLAASGPVVSITICSVVWSPPPSLPPPPPNHLTYHLLVYEQENPTHEMKMAGTLLEVGRRGSLETKKGGQLGGGGEEGGWMKGTKKAW